MTTNRFCPSAMAALWVCALGFAPNAASGEDLFFDLDLKEVLNLEITSVSKKPQTVSQAAAAVFVITSDDIRRSGANNVPDVLRTVPGIQVAQISNNAWAVSARGMAGRYSNKLLVLIDGRSVYSPMFSGVHWDVQDVLLSDVERIEIIRGPGASLWGANAVNGVINILTKSAAATQGSLLEASAGTREDYALAARYGGKLADVGHWRLYGKAFDREASIVESTGARGNDEWKQQRVGFRVDLAASPRDALTVQGDFYQGRSGESASLNMLQAPYRPAVDLDQRLSGANLLARWQRDVSASDSFTLQSYLDHTQRNWPAHVNETRSTFDVDLQYRTRRLANHDLVIGTGYRQSRDRNRATYSGVPADVLQFVTFADPSNSRRLYSLYFQDDITLIPAKLVLTLGSKLEHNDNTGFENQPNARLLWMPSESSTFWGSAARAVRTPSRFDDGGYSNFTVVPPLSSVNPSPLPVLVVSYGDTGSEYLTAYELGWKQRIAPALSLDLALFHNEYEDLRSARYLSPFCVPSLFPASGGCFLFPGQSHMVQVSASANDGRAKSHGVEIAADWRALPNLRLQLAWAALRMRIHTPEEAFSTDQEGNAARRQASLRVAWNPRSDVDVDFSLRHVGKLPKVDVYGSSVDRYNEADLRLAWRPQKGVEVGLVGRNLLHRRHAEFVSEVPTTQRLLMERTFYGQLVWRF